MSASEANKRVFLDLIEARLRSFSARVPDEIGYPRRGTETEVSLDSRNEIESRILTDGTVHGHRWQ